MIERSISEYIADINILMAEIDKDPALKIKTLTKVTQNSYELIKRVNNIFKDLQTEIDISDYIAQTQRILEQLHQVEQGRDDGATPPNKMLDQLTTSFEKFFNKVLSKEHQEHLKVLVEYIPYINNVAYCCQTMPYFWAHANRTQKVAIVLSAALIVTSLVLSVAIAASPALPALPIVGSIAMIFSRIGRVLYNRAITESKDKYEDLQTLKKTQEAIEEQYQFFNDKVKPQFESSKLTKKTLTYQDDPKPEPKTKIPQEKLSKKIKVDKNPKRGD